MSSASFVCPFCPLHCDDLQMAKLVRNIRTQSGADADCGGEEAGDSESCPLLQQRLDAAIEHQRSSAATEATLATAGQWIEQAEQIWITGRVLDLQTARAVCRFAEQTGAGVSVAADPAAAVETAAYCETFARDGGFATTLGDAAAAHTSVILIGDPSQRWPRLSQRIARAGELYAWQNTNRLSERLAHLRRLLRRSAEPAPTGDPDLVACRELCNRAISVVFVVVPEVLGAGEAIPVWSTVTGLLRDLNGRIRAALLRFDETLTFRSVRAWNGQQAAGNGLAQAQSAADLVIELVPWNADDATCAGAIAVEEAYSAARRITIGWQSATSEAVSTASQTCYLPASAGGIGRAAIVLRGDGSVALPLRPLVVTALPSPAELLAQLAPQRVRSATKVVDRSADRTGST